MTGEIPALHQGGIIEPPSHKTRLTPIAEHLGLNLNQIANLGAEWTAGDAKATVRWEGVATVDADTFHRLIGLTVEDES